MGKGISQAAQALLAAIDAEKEARALAQQAEAAFEEARKSVGEAAKAVYEARIAADAELPQCTFHQYNRYTGNDVTTAGVIVGRTAKEIKARAVGDTRERRFRKGKHFEDRWWEYPAPKGYSSTSRWVTFDGAAAMADKGDR